MKNIFVCIFLIIICFCQLLSQKFSKYQTWASEKYQYPGYNNANLKLNYDSTKFVLKGNWNYRLDNNIPISSLAFVMSSLDRISIYTLETQGYRTQDPLNPYDDSRFVNHQEGTKLDTIKWDHDSTFNDPNIPGKIDTIHIYDPPYGAYTTHPTIQRWMDNTNPAKFPVPSDIKYAVSYSCYALKQTRE